MMQNPRMRRMAVPLNIPRKRSNTGLIIGSAVIFILLGIGVGVLIWYLNSDCYARDEIDAECSDDDKCCKESKLKCELNKCCGKNGFKCSNNDECCDLNCDGGSCKQPQVECTKKDNECSANDDCCDDLNCNSDNICADCKLKNVSCSDSNECCNENCSGGKCYEETSSTTLLKCNTYGTENSCPTDKYCEWVDGSCLDAICDNITDIQYCNSNKTEYCKVKDDKCVYKTLLELEEEACNIDGNQYQLIYSNYNKNSNDTKKTCRGDWGGKCCNMQDRKGHCNNVCEPVGSSLGKLYEEVNTKCKNSFKGQDTQGDDFLLFSSYNTDCDGGVNAGVCCNNKSQGNCGTGGLDKDPRCKSKPKTRHFDNIFQNACPTDEKLTTRIMAWDPSCRGDLGGRCINSTGSDVCRRINVFD